MLGETVVYMVEVINMVQAISLNYGTITRDSPVRSDPYLPLICPQCSQKASVMSLKDGVNNSMMDSLVDE